jgi:hypothetical protein
MGKTPKRITADNVKKVAGDASTKKATKEELELPYQCDVCGKRFKSSQGKAGHMNTHKIETVDMEDEDEKEEKEDPKEWVLRYARKPIVNQEVIDILAEQEKVTFVIPEDPLDNRLNYSLGINGQKFDYPVGQYVVIPRNIVTQIKNTYKETETAKRRKLVERNQKVQDALS